MSDIIIAALGGGLIGIMGSFLAGFFQYLKWKKEARIMYWKEKRDKLDNLNSVLPSILQGIITDDFSHQAVTDLFMIMGSDLSPILEKYSRKGDEKTLSENERYDMIGDILRHFTKEKEKYDKKIESLLDSWF